MNLWVLLPIIVVIIALRFVKLNILAWLAVWWVAIFLALSYAIVPPIPKSIVGMFMFIITLSELAYLAADSESLDFAKRAMATFLMDKKYSVALTIVVIALPVLVAAMVYMNASKQPQPPVEGRTIHPPPPANIVLKGRNINLTSIVNPYRELEESNPQNFENHTKNGRRIYYQNCAFCHGDNMEGNGIFWHGLDPIPANFADPTTIAMLQESYLFWRIAKGAPGLPEESSPWASSMPAWEDFLSEEEIWDVIIFLYDFTGQKPRAQEHVE
jgi:mono/diheme cytochrome c family protein